MTELPISERSPVIAAIALAGLLGGAAPSGLTLTDNVPGYLADALTTRALAKAMEIGLTDVQELGKPYGLSRKATTLGILVSGRGTDARPGGQTKTCFIAMLEPGSGAASVLPTIGRGRWGEESCHGYTALGLLPSRPGFVRLGILYDSDKQPFTIPVILAWHDGDQPSADEAGTTACVARHVTTITEMRRPGCGAPSKLERAFPQP